MGINDSILNIVEGRAGTASRYLIVSMINVVNHQLLLLLANSVWGWPGGLANAFAASVALIPAYLLTRAWVWAKTGSHSMSREVVPFFALAALGLVVSSISSEIAERIFGAGLWVNVGSLIGYVGVWIVKFFVLERIFAAAGADQPDHNGEPVGVR